MIAVEKAIAPVIESPGKVAVEASRHTDWTLIGMTILLLGMALIVLRFRKRSEKTGTSSSGHFRPGLARPRPVALFGEDGTMAEQVAQAGVGLEIGFGPGRRRRRRSCGRWRGRGG